VFVRGGDFELYIIQVATRPTSLSGEIHLTTDIGNAVHICPVNSDLATNSDTITLEPHHDRGSRDVVSGSSAKMSPPQLWQVRGMLTATGAAFATPFSATV
jgi:hypothetical protein